MTCTMPIRDWVAESHPPDEGREGLSEGFMNEFIASLGDKWRRESRDSRGYDAGMVNRVFSLLPYMNVYEWRILMYLLGPREVARRGPFEVFGTVMPEWTPEMVLTYQVLCAGCTEVTEKLIRAAGGDIQRYSSSLKSAKMQIAAVDRCEGGLSLLMGEPAARTLYREKGWRPSVVDPYAARCGTSTLTATSVRTGFHYLDLMKALPDVFVAKFGPKFVWTYL